jgi:hypothetical protein
MIRTIARQRVVGHNSGALNRIMILTKKILNKGRSSKGGFSKKQVELLGLDFNDLWKGWQAQIIGENYHEATIKKFIALKDSHVKKVHTPSKTNITYSKLTESEWKVILDDFQRKLFNLPKETEIILLK